MEYSYFPYLNNGSWFGVLHRVMDARQKLEEQEKKHIRFSRGNSQKQTLFRWLKSPPPQKMWDVSKF